MIDPTKLPTVSDTNANFQKDNPQYFARSTPPSTSPSTPTPTPPATPAPAAAPAVASPYYPRNTNVVDGSGNADKPFGSGPGSSTPTTDSFYAELYGQSRGIIDSINQDYQAKVDAAKLKATNASKGINAVAANSGMSGSPDAYKGEASVSEAQAADIAAASAARTKDTETLLSSISSEAYTRQQNDKTFKKGVETEQYNRSQTQYTKAQGTVKNLASKGHSLEEIKTTYPDAYQTLLGQYGGDETALTADYLANLPVGSILNGEKPIATSGSKAVYAIKDPITNKISTMEVDAGIDLSDPKNKEVIRIPNKGLFVYDKNTNTGHLISGETPGSTSAPKTSGKLQYTNDDVSTLSNLMRNGGDIGGATYAPADAEGHVDATLYEEMYNQWLDNGGLPQDFSRLYPPKVYVNPADNAKLPSFLQNREKTTSTDDFSSTFGS